MSHFTHGQSPKSRKVSDSRAMMEPTSGFSSPDQPRTEAGGTEEKGWAERRECRMPKPDTIRLKRQVYRESDFRAHFFSLSVRSLPEATHKDFWQPLVSGRTAQHPATLSKEGLFLWDECVLKISSINHWQHSFIIMLVSLSASKSTPGVTALKLTPVPSWEL